MHKCQKIKETENINIFKIRNFYNEKLKFKDNVFMHIAMDNKLL